MVEKVYVDFNSLRNKESHKGKKQSSETVAKRVAKNIGKKRTDEQKAKTSKPVCQFNLEGILIATYFGVREASRCTGINGSHIGDCCNHKNCWRVQMGVAIKARDAGSAHPQARELAHPLHMEFLRRNY